MDCFGSKLKDVTKEKRLKCLKCKNKNIVTYDSCLITSRNIMMEYILKTNNKIKKGDNI